MSDFNTRWTAVWGPLEDAFANAEWDKVKERLAELDALVEPLGPMDQFRARAAEAHARVAEMNGRVEEADQLFEQAEKIFRAGGTLLQRELASVCMSRGDLYRRRGDWQRALVHFDAALPVYEALVGMHALEVITCLGRIGTANRRVKNLAGAERAFRRAVRSGEKALGTDSEDLAWLLVQHADVKEAQGALDDAANLLDRALGIYTAKDSLKSMHGARALHALNRVCRKKGEYERAESYCKQAMEARKTLLGEGHPETIESVGSYALLLRAMGREQEAQEYEAREKELLAANKPN